MSANRGGVLIDHEKGDLFRLLCLGLVTPMSCHSTECDDARSIHDTDHLVCGLRTEPFIKERGGIV